MSSHDASSDPVQPASHPSRPAASRGPASWLGSALIRTLILVGVLIALLGALWYDRNVARPAVERAYDSIAQLNDEVNADPNRKYLTNRDVQEALHRAPSETFQQGDFQVEVYRWRSGLPIRSHDYFALYSAGNVFMTHFKFKLPVDDLETPQLEADAGSAGANPVRPALMGDTAGSEEGLGEGDRRPVDSAPSLSSSSAAEIPGTSAGNAVPEPAPANEPDAAPPSAN